MRVRTDHKIVPFGDNLMGLFDMDGNLTVQAERNESGWLVTASGASDTQVADRSSAITAMTDTALTVLGGTGYSTLVPRGLRDQP